jgi:Na+/H+ antiporter NhaD/arsenite permease-like protein
MTALLIAIFILGYAGIALEHQVRVNKAATALLIGVLCWTVYMLDIDRMMPEGSVPSWFTSKIGHSSEGHLNREYLIEGQLLHTLAEIAQILFFLMGAMTIVELVDAHEGFALVTDRIRAKSKTKLLWTIGWLTFFLSAILDNLTTTIVMVSLLRKLVHDRPTRKLFVGLVIIAANAGGAWSVIGDVTTTMLWVKGKIGTVETASSLFLASVACLLVPLLVMTRWVKGDLEVAPVGHKGHLDKNLKPWHQWLFLMLGVGGLLSVPFFKASTHLPPFMGMLLALSILWLASEWISHTLDEQTRSSTGVLSVLQRIDMSSILFFLGILLAVGSLGATGILNGFATWLDQTIPSRTIVATVIGLVSAIVDNVPLVAAGIEMYELAANDPFWMMLAYCAGTGGSCLIIGSAAGVAAMGLEHIDFMWYVRKITPLALLGYFAGMLVYLLQVTVAG